MEVAGGKYPYENDNMFAQLKAIIDEEPPTLPSHFSEEAHFFITDWQVSQYCMHLYDLLLLTMPIVFAKMPASDLRIPSFYSILLSKNMTM